MILFDNVTKTFPNNTTALDSINLEVKNGEFIFLVGQSGAGKTTLLRLLIKEIVPTHGSIFLDDWEINKLSPGKVPFLRRRVGFIFQDFKLLYDRTVTENITVAAEILGLSSSEVEKRTKRVLKVVHLENRANYFPAQLSYGEQQRVAIGRAVIGDVKVLLADEPTGNLDPKTSWEILKIINSINKQGKAVICATHNVDIVDSLKKRVVVLDKGKIVRDEKKSRYS